VVDCICKWSFGFVGKKTEIKFKEIKISFSNGELGCKVLGCGEKKMISFHGFGQNGLAFIPLSRAMSEFTFYSIELPFHGSSRIYNPQQPITYGQVNELVKNLMAQEEISSFSVCAFSIGAKLLFPIIENFSRVIDQVIFLAPEGIRNNFWYRLATGTRLARSIFFMLANDHKAMQILIGLAAELKIISRKTGSFVRRTLTANGRGRLVYDTWCYLRLLKLHHKKAAGAINDSRMAVVFVYGLKDNIIRKNTMIPLYRKLRRSEVIELPCGHHDLIRHFSRSR
jgi:hypothetical protein